MTDKTQERRGAAVSILSVVLITYILGGGEFKNEASFYGSIVFDRPLVVKSMFILVHLYTAYRFYLSASKHWIPFRNKIRKQLFNSSKFKKFVLSLANQPEIKSKIEASEILTNYNEKDLNTDWINRNNLGYTDEGRKVFANLAIQERAPGKKVVKDFKVEIPRLTYWPNFFLLSKSEERFWAEIFPWILFFTSIILWVLRLAYLVFIKLEPYLTKYISLLSS